MIKIFIVLAIIINLKGSNVLITSTAIQDGDSLPFKVLINLEVFFKYSQK